MRMFWHPLLTSLESPRNPLRSIVSFQMALEFLDLDSSDRRVIYEGRGHAGCQGVQQVLDRVWRSVLTRAQLRLIPV